MKTLPGIQFYSTMHRFISVQSLTEWMKSYRGWRNRSGFQVATPRKGVVICCVFLVASLTGHSQQNLFNIPSGDITPKNKVFYQHQLNFYSIEAFESKSHVVIGLGKGWDGGVNLVDLPLRLGAAPVLSFNDDSQRKPLYPLVMFTLQKQVTLGANLKLNVGTQAGPNISPNTWNKKIAVFNYALFKTKLLKRINLVAGPYHTDDTFVGRDQHHIGFMIGYEAPISKKLSLMGDMISGNHKKSQTTVGALYTLSKRTQLCAAALLDFPHGMNNHGVVIELNIFGWDIETH